MVIYLILIVLLMFSGFFSSLETSLYALGEVTIREWSEDKIKGLKLWLNDPTAVVTGILVGNNLVNIVFSSIFTYVIVKIWLVPDAFSEILSIIISSGMILVFGEIIPKTYANTYPDRVTRNLYIPFLYIFSIIEIVITVLNKASFSIVGKFNKKKEKKITRGELHVAVEEIKRNGLLKEESSKMFNGVLVLTKKAVADVMKPRDKVVGIDLENEYKDVLNQLVTSKYTRILAYKKSLDNFKGFIYKKDVIRSLIESGSVNFEDIIRKAHVTYSGRNCQHLFQELRNKRTHSSLVISNNRIIGLITIEDLIEVIVGDIYDEYDIMGSSV